MNNQLLSQFSSIIVTYLTKKQYTMNFFATLLAALKVLLLEFINNLPF